MAMLEQSGTRIRGPSLVPEGSGPNGDAGSRNDDAGGIVIDADAGGFILDDDAQL